jgi:hypothetical protein
MNANRFISLSLDLWNGRKFLALQMLRGDEDRMLVTGRFIRLLCLCYDYDGVIDWTDDLVRRVVSSELGMQEDDAGAFIADCVRIGFFDAELWDAKRHATAKGVTDEIAYRRAKSEAGKKGGRPRKKPGDKPPAKAGA